MPKENKKKSSGKRFQPYQRDADIAEFQASSRSGRRNAVTEDELLPIAAFILQSASQSTDSNATLSSATNASESTEASVAEARIGHVSDAQTTETTAANLPTDLSNLKFDDKDLTGEGTENLPENNRMPSNRHR